MNNGKNFEQDFKNSVPDDWFYYRLIDGTSSWGGNESVRFQAKNICDCLIYNGQLHMIELKSHKGKSLPINCIKQNQINGLVKAYDKGVNSWIIVNFSDVEETYVIEIYILYNYIKTTTRKSIPIGFFKEYGYLLQQEKKRTRFKYNLKGVLNES